MLKKTVKKYHLLLTIRMPVIRKILIMAAVERESSRKEDVNGEKYRSIKPILLMIMVKVGYQKEKSVYVDSISLLLMEFRQ